MENPARWVQANRTFSPSRFPCLSFSNLPLFSPISLLVVSLSRCPAVRTSCFLSFPGLRVVVRPVSFTFKSSYLEAEEWILRAGRVRLPGEIHWSKPASVPELGIPASRAVASEGEVPASYGDWERRFLLLPGKVPRIFTPGRSVFPLRAVDLSIFQRRSIVARRLALSTMVSPVPPASLYPASTSS